MTFSIISTKLYFPPMRFKVVARPRLVEKLTAGMRGPLTLISAPVGYGKTTLMSEWHTGSGEDFPAAWLSLDSNDDDLERFLKYLTAALETIKPGIGSNTAALLNSPQLPPFKAILTTFINDIDKTIEILTDLKVRGLQIAIDDFGTGYSSLSYLNRFPIDRLKIDRSFVADIATNEDDRVLVSLVAEMGRKLGLNVIAEGVEDDTQKNLLIGMGCDAIQGFLFGLPVPLDEFCARHASQETSL